MDERLSLAAREFCAIHQVALDGILIDPTTGAVLLRSEVGFRRRLFTVRESSAIKKAWDEFRRRHQVIFAGVVRGLDDVIVVPSPVPLPTHQINIPSLSRFDQSGSMGPLMTDGDDQRKVSDDEIKRLVADSSRGWATRYLEAESMRQVLGGSTGSLDADHRLNEREIRDLELTRLLTSGCRVEAMREVLKECPVFLKDAGLAKQTTVKEPVWNFGLGNNRVGGAEGEFWAASSWRSPHGMPPPNGIIISSDDVREGRWTHKLVSPQQAILRIEHYEKGTVKKTL